MRRRLRRFQGPNTTCGGSNEAEFEGESEYGVKKEKKPKMKKIKIKKNTTRNKDRIKR